MLPKKRKNKLRSFSFYKLDYFACIRMKQKQNEKENENLWKIKKINLYTYKVV